jgi:quercetin dioxygenase-like cupin family protein
VESQAPPELIVEIREIPFDTTDWTRLPVVEHPGADGVARWRTRQFGAIRVRMVEYSPGYRADHWCHKGHILLCLEGTLHTELADGRVMVLSSGMSYQVADGAEPHRSFTPTGARLFIVD